MRTASDTVQFEIGDHVVSGRYRAASPADRSSGSPLIVALHGGGFSSLYFDCPGHSLLERASQAGLPAIALDRPGYGSSTPLAPGEHAVRRNAQLLGRVIGEAWRSREFDASGIVLVGHSVGSGVALYMASEAVDWPLLGVAFAGLGVSPPTGIPPFWTFRELDDWVHNPSQDRLSRMFGPRGTYQPGADELCDSVSEPVWWREIVDMYTPWDSEFAQICANIDVPVLYRQGELDPLWANGPDQLALFANAFTHSPRVDAKAVPNTGHCIDFHLSGRACHEEQIAFAVGCAAPATSSEPDELVGKAPGRS